MRKIIAVLPTLTNVKISSCPRLLWVVGVIVTSQENKRSCSVVSSTAEPLDRPYALPCAEGFGLMSDISLCVFCRLSNAKCCDGPLLTYTMSSTLHTVTPQVPPKTYTLPFCLPHIRKTAQTQLFSFTQHCLGFGFSRHTNVNHHYFLSYQWQIP